MKLLILILISILVTIFAIQNSAIVSVSFFNRTFEGSLALVIILCYLIGVLSGFFYLIPSILRKNITISELKEKSVSINKEKENKQL
ncbi:MAG: LapA family protein [Proteobacteria bacterium]|nr:LapA family protein [Pseudomonadota bacterium]